MANPPVIALVDAEPLRGDICYRCGDPSQWLVHDGRGCVPACDSCRRWRELRSIVGGHAADCPTKNAPTTPAQ